jgi:serine protease inhibitor ecotin
MIKAKAVTYVRKCLRWRFMIARLQRYLRLKTTHFAPKEQQQCWRVTVIITRAAPRPCAFHRLSAQDSTEKTGKGFKYVSVSHLQS